MRRSPTPYRAGVAAAATVVLLAACGAPAGSDPASSSTVTDPSSLRELDGPGEFCTRAPLLVTRFESVPRSIDADFLQQVFQQELADTRAIEPPAEVAPDWAALADGLARLADFYSDADVTDPSQAAVAEQLQGQVETSLTKVEGHLAAQCGVDDSGPGSQGVFVGDFETGDFRQWTQCQNRSYSGPCKEMAEESYSMQVLDSGAHQGQYVARFELRDGDKPAWGGGERAEVARYSEGTVHEGDERWYEFSLMFDPAFPPVTGEYFMVMQWHGADDLPPPLAIEVQGDGQLVLTSHFPAGPPMVIGDIERGQWVDYVVHAGFSQSSETGWAEVYRNGVLTVPRHPRATMNSDHDYLKMGLYRDGRGSYPTAVMWADGLRVTAP